MSNSLDPDQARRFVGPDLGPNCLPKLSADDVKLRLQSLIQPILSGFQISRVVRKPDFCIFENKDADQLRGNREADQRLCFRYMDSTIPLLPKSEISSF